MSGSTVSRRVSEFVGVALFAAALHLDHLARQLRAERPGLVLQHRRARRAGQLRRPRRRVPRRAVVPAVRLRRVPDSRGDGGRRLELLLVPDRSTPPAPRRPAPACCSAASARSSAWCSARSRSRASRSAPAATSASGSRTQMSEYLNRTGSVIVILTLILLAIIMSTQFSFGRFFAAVIAGVARRRDPRPRRRSANGARNGAARSSAAR